MNYNYFYHVKTKQMCNNKLNCIILCLGLFRCTILFKSLLSDEVRGLVKVMIQFNSDKEASKLQETFGGFLSLIDTSIPSIWMDDSEEGEESVVSFMYIVLYTLLINIYNHQCMLCLSCSKVSHIKVILDHNGHLKV